MTPWAAARCRREPHCASVRDGSLPIREVAAALAYAHTLTDDAGFALGIVNRDVNPARIRLGPHGEVRLTDSGVALSRLSGRLAMSLPRPQGEVLYSAPEVLLGEVVDARADLFSLGLTLLEVATGRHLYDPGHVRIEEVEARLSKEGRDCALAASVASVVTELPAFAEDAIWCAMAYGSEDVEQAAQGLSVPLRHILHTLLRRNPAERFGTAVELELVLRSQLARLGGYTREEALQEAQHALGDASEGLWDFELPSDEGGITPPVTQVWSRSEPTTDSASPRGARRASFDSRNPDEVPTEPGAGPRRRTLTKQPTAYGGTFPLHHR